MQIFSVDGLCFDFPDDWLVTKYDDWAFYRKQFVRMWDGIKAVDLLALSPEGTLYLIEAKDYRRHRREKGLGIADEAAHKAFDTLAALLPAKIRAPDGPERDVAMRFLSAVKLQVVLHLEQPQTQSRLFPRIDPANVLQKLRQLVKPLDAHPVVAENGAHGISGGEVGGTLARSLGSGATRHERPSPEENRERAFVAFVSKTFFPPKEGPRLLRKISTPRR